MENDSVPILEPFDFVHVEETDEQRIARDTLNMSKTNPSTPQKQDCSDLAFQGQCFDEDDNVWTHCYEFEVDASIQRGGPDTSFHRVRNTVNDNEIDLGQVCLLRLRSLDHLLPSAEADIR